MGRAKAVQHKAAKKQTERTRQRQGQRETDQGASIPLRDTLLWPTSTIQALLFKVSTASQWRHRLVTRSLTRGLWKHIFCAYFVQQHQGWLIVTRIVFIILNISYLQEALANPCC